MSEVSDQTGEIERLPVFWRAAPAPASASAAAPALYLHGVPVNSDVWLPFLERTGGLAPDLPGFGRSGKPAHFDYTIEGYADFLERYLELAGAHEVSLVVHGWGAVGLAFAQRHPERVQRLAVINAVPLLSGHRWHRIARVWRTPLLGELAMGVATPRVVRRVAARDGANVKPLPDSALDSVLDHFDQGTQRAILRLYRSASEAALAQAGAHLDRLRMPALVLWGARDPYTPASFAERYAAALGGAQLVTLPDAGHWPWLDRPDVIDTLARFLDGGSS